MSATSSSQPVTTQAIELVVLNNHNWFAITNSNEEVDELLYDHFSWEDTGFRKPTTTKYLYHKDKKMAPIGLLHRTKELLEEEGYEISITQEVDKGGDNIETEWMFPHDLRDYQHEAVNSLVDERGGIVSIPTGGGKTVISLKFIDAIKQRSIILVHTTELLHQWKEEIEKTLGIEPGVIGDGNWTEGDVTVATMQSLNDNLDQLEENYGIAVFDECHVTSAAEVTHQIGLNIEVEYRIGLSATPWRRIEGEEIKIEGAIGGKVYSASAEHLIKQGYLAEPKFEFTPVPDQNRLPSDEDYSEKVKHCIELDVSRNQAVANKAAELADAGHKTLVDVDRINQGHLIQYALDKSVTAADTEMAVIDSGTDEYESLKKDAIEQLEQVSNHTVYFLHGSASRDIREQVFNDFERGNIDILISTLVKEGVDIPRISAIVNASGGKSKTQNIQVVGRALRPENGNEAQVIDIDDTTSPFNNHSKYREKTYKNYYGNYGPDNGFCEEVKAVREFLFENHVDAGKCRLEKTPNGKVTIELDDFLGGSAFDRYRDLMRNTDGIKYDGEKNYCQVAFIEALLT